MKTKNVFKTILFLIIIIFYNNLIFSQNDKQSIVLSKLTEVMLQKKYSINEIEELKKYPDKLKSLDYLFSKSFEVSAHQSYSQEQFEKIDILLYDIKRKVDERVLVFDEASGLSLVLYSLNQIELDTKEISKSSIPTQNSSNKIPN